MSRSMPLHLALLSSLLLSLPVHSQPSADEIIAQAQQRAGKIDEYRQLLNNPDQNVRLAGLDILLKSDDPAMREIAFSLGFASLDDTMRAITLKNRFSDLKVLNFQMSLRDKPTETEKSAIVEKFGGVYAVKLKSYDVNTGWLVFSGGEGQVVGTGLDFQRDRCRGSFLLGEGAVLEGVINCKGISHYDGSYKATLRLQ